MVKKLRKKFFVELHKIKLKKNKQDVEQWRNLVRLGLTRNLFKITVQQGNFMSKAIPLQKISFFLFFKPFLFF